MDVASTELHSENQTDTFPLLMERQENPNSSEHIIDIRNEVSVSPSHNRISTGLEASLHEDRPLSGVRAPTSPPPTSLSNGTNSRSSSLIRRGEARRRRSPLNSGLWISVELVLTLSQIIASIVVLSVSRKEHPRAPLFAWIVGYASGCVATLPLLYWRYSHRNQALEQDSAQNHQGSAHINVPAGPFSLSVSRNSEGEDRRSATTSPRGGQNAVLNARLKVLLEYFKMALDCFFAVWFVVGNVWIFGSHSSAEEAPNLYRLCIVFLTFSCIGYAMPFILCATICCCLPCIISILGFREDLTQTRGATPESIDALPTHKFKLIKNRNGEDSSSGAADGGIVAAGTEKERVISGEDAVCCICLAKYANNDELRELPCSHFFHKDCVDKWLKINASCPLCKSEVGESILGSLPGLNSSQRRVENGAGNGMASTMF
ncbi:hypothetical protein POPTR_018G034400v4 [Populus trichocarpa]|uniref:RING-type domain-containing protein n=1 Tax=Populus trichocarpa TaxID=3694 RepID=A0A2K1WVB6_POPTR|nr:E3 ubiquitin-protein ligase At1g63170 [Populus trichocarpa]KAI5556356.1 hypothetical protein BDE02_18G028900 [Populus trichocarpa]PNS92469.1 hypothetical protein POPTR_018G034400v4 [Populus trichocarpa]|eukprot:XP_024445414.1 E3 ubiquitin-protein ligase At1g63170 [Populus trichocarpa]